MSESQRKTAVCVALLVGLSCASSARASEDVFGTGDGHHGALVASQLGETPNRAAALTSAVSAADTVLEVDDPSAFAAGDLVLIWQASGVSAPSSGDATPLSVGSSGVGHHELARIVNVTASSIELSDPVMSAYPLAGTQVVFIPEHTTVSVPAGTSLVAMPWDPIRKIGGILAIFATGAITNAGSLDASGRGMHGGVVLADTTASGGCMALTEAAPGGAAIGESIALNAYGPSSTGRGNVANGGGGGVCFGAGGGGGGHIGAGGLGGQSSDGSRAVGGLGGAALTYTSLASTFTIGGGGGAGQGNGDETGGSGGAGGGFVFVRAASLSGAGTIVANGEAPPAANVDGSGGGGAGGSVLVQVVKSAVCEVAANGGSGASAAQASGTGGGGGGGRALVQGASVTCPRSVSGGAAGLFSGDTQGASDGASGSVDTAPSGGLNIDHDGDGLLDVSEGLTDSDGDLTPDYLDADDDGDGVETKYELGPTKDLDTDLDDLLDYLDADDDGDSVPTKDEGADTNGDGNPKDALDHDKDGVPDFRDDDDDGDGIDTRTEREDANTWGKDVDKDKLPNWLDTDSDGDGFLDAAENVGGGDRNHDGRPDYLDAKAATDDTDSDGVSDTRECPAKGQCPDSDGDGTPDYADSDDDGDTLATVDERPGARTIDSDRDGSVDYLDDDDDGDGVPTKDEVEHGKAIDTDRDELPDHRDTDDDDDGIPTASEAAGKDDDVDDDGLPNWRDDDSDGDGVSDHDEGVTDADDNGIPAYLDSAEVPDDLDQDSVPDATECPDRSTCPDTDGDGTSDERDDDDDGDGVPTKHERAGGKSVDRDGDGTPDYLDDDDDGDGLSTKDERPDGHSIDSDRDGDADYLDDDDDDDGVATQDELFAGRPRDTDADGVSDHLDPDDDGDGVKTSIERKLAKQFGEDLDKDGLVNYLDEDSDGDGVPDSAEGLEDQDGDGIPDSFTKGGISGGALCSAAPGARDGTAWPAFALAVAFASVRFRSRQRQRRRTVARDVRRLPTCVVGAVLLLAVAGPARAEPAVALDQLRLRAITEDGWSASRTDMPEHLSFQGQLLLDYTNDPLVYESSSGSSNSERVSLVSDQLRAHLGVSLGLLDFALVYLQLPVDIVFRGDALGLQPTATGFGGGDLALGARAVFWKRPAGALGLELQATLPTAKNGDGVPGVAGDEGPTLTPLLIGELTFPLLRVTANAGVRIRKHVYMPGLSLGNELTYSLAFGVPLVKRKLEAQLEAFGVTPTTRVGTRVASPLELLLGLKLRAGERESWSFGLASGMGVLRGYGAPDFRVLALAGFRIGPNQLRTQEGPPPAQEPADDADEPAPITVKAPPPPPSAAVTTALDDDHDGVPDAEDQCPILPGPVDLGGCPQLFTLTAETGKLEWNPALRWKRRSPVLQSDGHASIEELGSALHQNPKLRIVVALHTLPEGDPAELMQLTVDRGKAFVAELVERGAKPEQIDAYACGGTRPIAPLHTRSAGQNDRADVFVINPYPPSGMPSTLGCQPLTPAATPAAPGGKDAPSTPAKPEALREFGSVLTPQILRQCALHGAVRGAGPLSAARRRLELRVHA